MKLPVPPNRTPPNLWRPTWEQTRDACRKVALAPVKLSSPVFNDVVSHLRESHSNGGAHLATFHVSPNDVFDWFASRNRLLQDSVLASILSRSEVRQSLPDLLIEPEVENDAAIPAACSTKGAIGFRLESPFLLDGHLASKLYMGGAYGRQRGDGSAEKQLALKFCQEAFGLRYSDISYHVSCAAWTEWFQGIAWDVTMAIFDKKERNLWVLAITDTD